LRQLGARIGNDPSGELLVRDAAGGVGAVIEVASGTGAPLLEQAVGRLMLRGAAMPRDARRWLVAPGDPGEDLAGGLAALGIRFIAYGWEAGQAVFEGLAGQLAEMGIGKARG